MFSIDTGKEIPFNMFVCQGRAQGGWGREVLTPPPPPPRAADFLNFPGIFRGRLPEPPYFSKLYLLTHPSVDGKLRTPLNVQCQYEKCHLNISYMSKSLYIDAMYAKVKHLQ